MQTTTGTSHSPRRSRTRILILEDHLLFAESLDLALSLQGYDVRRTAVPGSRGAVQGLLSTAARLQSDVTLLDLDLGGFGDGRRLIPALVSTGTRVVVVTASTDRGRWGDCLQSGAHTVVSKGRPLEDIIATVRRVEQGLPAIDPVERADLVRAAQQNAGRSELTGKLERLTHREQLILGRLMLGMSVREIATTSVVSEATVRTQVKSILAKLGVSSQLSAVGLAYRVGWEPPPA